MYYYYIIPKNKTNMVHMDICTEDDHANNYGGDNNNGDGNKFSLGLCELYNKKIHGYIPGVSDPNINGHYLVVYGSNSSSNDSDDNEDDVDINDMVDLYRREYTKLILEPQHQYQGVNNNNTVSIQVHGYEHDLIRNYYNIVSNINNYIKPEIFQKIYLSGTECCAVLKTVWIRIIQRAWKRVFRLHKTTGSELTVRGLMC